MPEYAKRRTLPSVMHILGLLGVVLCSFPVLVSFVLALVLYLREAGMQTSLGDHFTTWSDGILVIMVAAALAVAVLAVWCGRCIVARLNERPTAHEQDHNESV